MSFRGESDYQPSNAHDLTVIVLSMIGALALLLALGGCSGMVRAGEVTAATATGGGVGFLAGGPIGAVIGASVAAGGATVATENQALSEGSLTGKGALEAEFNRLETAIRQNTVTASVAAKDAQDAKISIARVEATEPEKEKHFHWVLWGLLAVAALLILKWWHTLRTEFYLARNAGVPFLRQLIKPNPPKPAAK